MLCLKIPYPNHCPRVKDKERRPGQSPTAPYSPPSRAPYPTQVPDDTPARGGCSLSVQRGRRCCGHAAWATASPRGSQPVALRPVSRAAGPAGRACAPPTSSWLGVGSSQWQRTSNLVLFGRPAALRGHRCVPAAGSWSPQWVSLRSRGRAGTHWHGSRRPWGQSLFCVLASEGKVCGNFLSPRQCSPS